MTPNCPPYQSIGTLAANLDVSDSAVDNWVRQGLLPPPKLRGGKRLWKWAEVVKRLDGDVSVPQSPFSKAEEIRNAVRRHAAA